MSYYQEKKRYNKYSNSFYDPIPSDFQSPRNVASNHQNNQDNSNSSDFTTKQNVNKGYNAGSLYGSKVNGRAKYSGTTGDSYNGENRYGYSNNSIRNKSSNQSQYVRNACQKPANGLIYRIFKAFNSGKENKDPIAGVVWPFIIIFLFVGLCTRSTIDYSRILTLTFLVSSVETLWLLVAGFSDLLKANDNIISKSVFSAIGFYLILNFSNFGCLTAINNWLDFLPSTERYVKILGKRFYTTTTRNRHGGTSTTEHFEVKFSPWKPKDISVDYRGLFDVCTEGDIVNVSTKPGLLGAEHWVFSKCFSKIYKESDFPVGTEFPILKENGDRLLAERVR